MTSHNSSSPLKPAKGGPSRADSNFVIKVRNSTIGSNQNEGVQMSGEVNIFPNNGKPNINDIVENIETIENLAPIIKPLKHKNKKGSRGQKME